MVEGEQITEGVGEIEMKGMWAGRTQPPGILSKGASQQTEAAAEVVERLGVVAIGPESGSQPVALDGRRQGTALLLHNKGAEELQREIGHRPVGCLGSQKAAGSCLH